MENIPSCLNYIVLIIAVMGVILASFVVPFLSGSFIGEMINPTAMHYECACDNHPVLTGFQAVIIGVTYMCCLSIALYCILRSLKLASYKRIVWLLVLLLLNGATCFIALDILRTQVSG